MPILSLFHEEKQSKYSCKDTQKCNANSDLNYKIYCLLHLNFVIKHVNNNYFLVKSHQLLGFFINLNGHVDLRCQKGNIINCG